MGIEIFSFPGEGFKGFRGFKVFILHASLRLGQYNGGACVLPQGSFALPPSLGGAQRFHWAIVRLCGLFVLCDDHSVGCYLSK